MATKPTANLKKFMEKRLDIRLNGNRHVVGILRGYDNFINIVLDNTVEVVSPTEKNELGMVVIRGNSILTWECLDRVRMQELLKLRPQLAPLLFNISRHGNRSAAMQSAKEGGASSTCSYEYPITYSSEPCLEQMEDSVKFLDVGCGYGGLMVALASHFPSTLMMGLEIREKVVNYVGKRVAYLQSQSNEYNNISVIKTNAMKFLPNYFRKSQLEKMFFCFPDPHFKQCNWRRRIINPSFLTVYAYLLKPKGRVYTVTDVFDLHCWMRDCQRRHPLFREIEVTEEVRNSDVCVGIIEDQTEEGKKVLFIAGFVDCVSDRSNAVASRVTLRFLNAFNSKSAWRALPRHMATKNKEQLTRGNLPHGSVVAIVTPMCDNDKAVDHEALRKLTDWHAKSGTQGIIVMGTTGENPTLTEDEFVAIIGTVKTQISKLNDQSFPLIVGTGTNSTRSTIARTQHAMSLGADAVLIVTPYYNKPSQEGLYQHYSAIVRECPGIPIILYNVPGRTSCDLLPSTVVRLAKEHRSIVAIKEASGKLERYEDLERQLTEASITDFAIYSGDDGLAIPGMLKCSQSMIGVISVTANIAPVLVQAACRHALEKDEAKATEIHNILLPLHNALFIEPSPAPVKFLLSQHFGVPGGLRLPLVPLSRKAELTLRETFTPVEAASATYLASQFQH